MATVEELVNDIRSLSPMNVPIPAVAKWLDNRYRELVSKARYRHLRKLGELVIPGEITTGTVTTTRGSTAVAGDSTTFETEVGSSGAQTHYYFRASSAWYKIASITDETNLVLDTAFSEDAVTDGSYSIVKRTHALASDARWINEFVHLRLRRPLDLMSPEELEITFPGRRLSSSYPIAVTLDGIESNGYWQAEFYPYPEDSEIIRYSYLALPTALTLGSTIPQQIEAYILKEGVLIDVYRYLKIKAIEAGQVEAAGIYRNDERAQATVWKEKIREAARVGNGVDDFTFILTGFGGRTYSPEIKTAREEILANWS
jgi:hypothetical protein